MRALNYFLFFTGKDEGEVRKTRLLKKFRGVIQIKFFPWNLDSTPRRLNYVKVYCFFRYFQI